MGWKRQILDIVGPLAFLAAVLLIGWRCWTYLRPEENPNHPCRSAMADFQDVVYYPTRAAMAGVNPYDARPATDGGVYYSRFPAGNSFPLYAPLVFVPSIPFALLPLVPAEIAYWFVNLGLLLLLSFIALRLAKLPLRVGTVTALAAFLLLSRPGHANFYFGALALPLSLATVGAWHFAQRRPWLSAVCVAIACIKPTFGGPLVILMLFRGNYRAFVLGLLLAVVLNVAVFAAFLPSEIFCPRRLEMLVHNQAVIDDDPAVDPLKSSSRVDFPFAIERIYGSHFPGYVRFGITFAVLAMAGWQLRRLPPDDEPARLLSLAIACLTIAICIYHNIYDGLLAVIPAAAAWGALRDSGQIRFRRLLLALVVLFAIPAVHYFSSKQFINLLAESTPTLFQFVSQPSVWTLLCTLNGISLMIAWCLLLFAAQTNFRQEPQPAEPV
jgi:hypothetical protein